MIGKEMAKKTVADIDVKGKKVLMRCDFNVPLDDNCNITSDDRIVKALPTIKKILEGSGSLILMSHLGRPKGKKDEKLSLAPVAKRLSELLGREVIFADDCIGPQTAAKAEALKPGDCMLLENLRFHKEETIKDKAAKEDAQLRQAKDDFAKELASMADIYVDDAFGTAHRDNASMYTVPMMMEGKPRVIGFLIEKELKFLGDALRNPGRPFIAILGGAKVSDKIGVIKHLLPQCDCLLIGGGMAYTFVLASGKKIGNSKLEKEKLDLAKEILTKASQTGKDIVLPMDNLVVDDIESGKQGVIAGDQIPDNKIAVDIGPKTIELFKEKLKGARTVVWNGPLGIFEKDAYASGTKQVALFLGESGAATIIGGGDTAAAIAKFGLEDKMTHISTGGGASLEFMEGRVLPGIAALTDKE
jgi:phosphoglycerate kinase